MDSCHSYMWSVTQIKQTTPKVILRVHITSHFWTILMVFLTYWINYLSYVGNDWLNVKIYKVLDPGTFLILFVNNFWSLNITFLKWIWFYIIVQTYKPGSCVIFKLYISCYNNNHLKASRNNTYISQFLSIVPIIIFRHLFCSISQDINTN